MLNLSIVKLNKNHIDEICQDIINQQKSGASTHAMFMMTFNPEYTPALNKAEEQCAIYDIYKQKLDKAGAKHGVLVQATLGHITPPRQMYPFQPSVNLVTGADRLVTCCPLDPNFHEYIKGQMRTLAKRHPSIVMLDDDLGLLYKQTKGCACKYHMAEFNRRAKTNMTREELYAHTQGTSEEDKKYTDIYVDVQRYGLVSAAKAMREGLDEVDPTIQGVVSGIYVTTFCEFSGDMAKAFAGKANPAIVRMNGGPYSMSSTARGFTELLFRAAILRENVKDKADVFLAETDTCPQNRYSTSAARMHAHFVGSILEGATGAKHWITRLTAFEPDSGKAYRKILSKYNGFYESLCEYVKHFRPFGCRIPLTLMQDYGFVPSAQRPALCSWNEKGFNLNPWASCVLERFGLPMYFANEGGGAVFLDDFSVDGFDDSEIKKFLSGTLILSATAAEKLYKRGFGDYVGVRSAEWSGKALNGELIGDILVANQYEVKHLFPICDGVEHLSEAIHRNADDTTESLFAGVARFENSLGGEVITFAGTPDMPFKYFSAFSLLNETRKKQFIKFLNKRSHLPLYYPEDGEIYLRAGRLNDNSIMAVFFNLGFDQLEDISFVSASEVKKIQKLNPDGTKTDVNFTKDGDIIRVSEPLYTLLPVVLFIS